VNTRGPIWSRRFGSACSSDAGPNHSLNRITKPRDHLGMPNHKTPLGLDDDEVDRVYRLASRLSAALTLRAPNWNAIADDAQELADLATYASDDENGCACTTDDSVA
jgi:hypothetical protein